jgi:1,4-alpha-glucan branching enzyme
MSTRFGKSWLVPLVVVCLFLTIVPLSFPSEAWLDGDPKAIWQRAPGFYQEGDHWYAVMHVKPSVTRVRLAGDFTNWATDAIDLTRTPDGKFWWFKGTAGSFPRAPAAGDTYKFILNEGESEDWWVQDPAARRVENSSLQANSTVTVSSDYVWHIHRGSGLAGSITSFIKCTHCGLLTVMAPSPHCNNSRKS